VTVLVGRNCRRIGVTRMLDTEAAPFFFWQNIEDVEDSVVDDSGLDAEDIIVDFIAGVATSPPPAGLADELEIDASDVVLAQPVPEFGRGKRIRKANQLYGNFEAH
jgi:hypothetical protein